MPTGLAPDQDFFEVFGPVFARNAFWSRTKPVPLLGGADEPMARVFAFYDFWAAFSSWREFAHSDEYDLSQAEGRFEKRYMERENRRLKAGLHRAEAERLGRLVAAARVHDFRLQRHLRQLEEERVRRKEELRKEKLLRVQSERERAEEQRREEREAEEERVRVRAEEERTRETLRRARKELEASFREAFLAAIRSPKHDSFYLDEVIPKLKSPALEELLVELRSGALATPGAFDARLRDTLKVTRPAEPRPAPAAAQPAETVWSDEQLSLLAKGLVRYPAGTQARWTRVVQYLGGEFSEAQVAAKASELKQNPHARAKPAAPVEESWTQAQQTLFEQALKRHRDGCSPRTKWERIASDVPGRSAKECVERFKHLREKLTKKKEESAVNV